MRGRGVALLISTPDSKADTRIRSFNQLVDNFEEVPIFNYMVKYDSHQLNQVFHALSDVTRRGMLASLALGEKTISELAQPFAMSLAGVSKHLKVLEGAGLVRREKRGRTHWCRLEPGPLASVHEWLSHYEQFWSARLDRLQQLLRDEGVAGAPSSEGE